MVEKYLEMARKRKKKPMRPRTAEKKKAVLLKFLKGTGVESTWDLDRGED